VSKLSCIITIFLKLMIIQSTGTDFISFTLLNNVFHAVYGTFLILYLIYCLQAAKSLCMWVRAIDLYARVYRTVEPKRQK
jgi:hypothetical protein